MEVDAANGLVTVEIDGIPRSLRFRMREVRALEQRLSRLAGRRVTVQETLQQLEEKGFSMDFVVEALMVGLSAEFSNKKGPKLTERAIYQWLDEDYEMELQQAAIQAVMMGLPAVRKALQEEAKEEEESDDPLDKPESLAERAQKLKAGTN